MSCHTQTKRRGFTLVELLVVIGIIALLISILLPALKRVKEQANSVKCLANIRQVMTACMMYVAEYKNALPIPVSIGNYYGATGENGSLMYYMSEISRPYNGAGAIRYDAGALWKFISPGQVNPVSATPELPGSKSCQKVMNCPTEEQETFRPVYWGGMQIGPGMIRNFSYSWNRQIRLNYDNAAFPGIEPACRKINQIKSPANKILLMEELAPNDGISYMLNNGGINTDDEPAFRHNGKGNYGFADGHAASMTPKQLGFKNPVDKNGNQHTTYENTILVKQNFLLTK